jgi:hypothetical protein
MQNKKYTPQSAERTPKYTECQRNQIMARPTALPNQTIKEIIRQRAMKVPTKVVAKTLDVSPDQVAHYWRTSMMYKAALPMPKWSNEKYHMTHMQNMRKAKANARMLEQAKVSLRAIIDEPSVPCEPFGTGTKLEW